VAIVEDEALILRALRYGETSRIVVAFGRRHGKVHLLAKGARDPKSPFGAALELGSRSEIIFYLKKSRDLHLVRSAAVLDPGLGLLAQPRAYHLACAALEFALKVLPDEDPCPEIHDLLCDYLAGLARPGGSGVGDGGLKGVQLRTVALLGYSPELTACVRCRAPVDLPGGFDVSEGGVLCRRCAPQGERLPLSRETLARLRSLVGGVPVTDEPSREVEREMTRVIESFLRFHLPNYPGLRALKSLADWVQLNDRCRPPSP
jgi:DNA repair protein RecO (recombination protein O)